MRRAPHDGQKAYVLAPVVLEARNLGTTYTTSALFPPVSAFGIQDLYHSLNSRRSVGLPIVEGRMNYGVSHRQAWDHARELMTLVRLEPEALDRYAHQFSGGQASASVWPARWRWTPNS